MTAMSQAAEITRVDPGLCLAFGGSKARRADIVDGDVLGFDFVETPDQPKDFFAWTSRRLLDASQAGQKWLVAGFPGPVSPDGRLVGPMVNVEGMSRRKFDFARKLIEADRAVEGVLEQGFTLMAVNDGTLAANAAASVVGEHKFNKTGALINGTGIGAGVVKKDQAYRTVHRADMGSPNEIGHIQAGHAPTDTYEYLYSGPGLERRYGESPKNMKLGHFAWQEVGIAMGRLAMTLGLLPGVNLVVLTGGVGAGASDRFEGHMRDYLAEYRQTGNQTKLDLMPEVRTIDPKKADYFEMYGADGVMRDLLHPAIA